MSVLRISPPFGAELDGYSIHDDHWTVSGDLREVIDLFGESTNNIVGEHLLAKHPTMQVDPEYSCFFAFLPTKAEAEALVVEAMAEAASLTTERRVIPLSRAARRFMIHDRRRS